MKMMNDKEKEKAEKLIRDFLPSMNIDPEKVIKVEATSYEWENDDILHIRGNIQYAREIVTITIERDF